MFFYFSADRLAGPKIQTMLRYRQVLNTEKDGDKINIGIFSAIVSGDSL